MAFPKKTKDTATEVKIPKNSKTKSAGFESGGLLGRLVKASKSESAGIMADYEDIAPRDFISAGNYLFNSLLAADPFKGLPSGKIITLAGPPGSGKTITMIEMLKNAQAMGYIAVLYDSEMANNDKENLKARGVDINRLIYIPIDTVEALKTSLLNILEEVSEDEKVFIGIDSLGNLSTEKEMRDSLEGSDKKDMTRAAQLKALFRTVTMKAGMKQIPIVCINHTYVNPGSFIPQNIVAGGCLTEKSLVKTTAGLRNIATINTGDKVCTMFGEKEVLETFSFEKETYRLTLADGSEIEATAEHKFLTRNGDNLIWKTVADLNENDLIIQY